MILLSRFLIVSAFAFPLTMTVAAQTTPNASSQAQVPPPAPVHQQGKPKFSVQDVIDLVKAGMGDDLVIAAIRKSGTALDLGAAKLLKLKRAGVSDVVIRAMIDSTHSTGTAIAGDPATANPSNLQTGKGLVQISKATEVGFYLLQGETPIQISARSFTTQKAGGGLTVLKMVGTAGLSKVKQKAVLRGSHARIRTTQERPQFLFYAPESFSPADYLVVRFEQKRGKREVIVGGMGALTGVSVGFEDDTIMSFSHKKLATRKYLVDLANDLDPGEYCFYPAGGLEVAGAVNATGRLYDFGIDK